MSSHKKRPRERWREHPFLSRKGINLIKRYQAPRIDLGMGRYAAYKDYGEDIWRIGYGSKKLGKRWLCADDKATEDEINEQLEEAITKLYKGEESFLGIIKFLKKHGFSIWSIQRGFTNKRI